MSGKKDMRRADLIVPFTAPEKDKSEADVASTLTTTLPMMAIFTKSKLMGWTAVMFALQSWLAETEESKKTSTAPGIFGVGMSFMSLVVSYMPLFLPPPVPRGVPGSGTGTGAAAPVPPA